MAPSGAARPEAVRVGIGPGDADLDQWWRYFARASTTGASWGTPHHVPVFEGQPLATDLLLADPAEAYPDLAQLALAIAVQDGALGLLPRPVHPYATGYRVTRAGVATDLPLDVPWPLPPSPAGEHTADLAVLTRYAALRPAGITYRTTAGR